VARSTPFTDAERMKIRVLHGKGWSATRIATELGRSTRGVTRIAAQMGMHFDHAQTAHATRAAAIDMRACRARLAERALIEAEEMFDDLHRPYMDHAFSMGGDPEQRYSQHAALPTPADKAQLMRAATSALAEHRRLAEFDSDEGAAAAKSLLSGLGQALRTVADGLGDSDQKDEGATDER